MQRNSYLMSLSLSLWLWLWFHSVCGCAKIPWHEYDKFRRITHTMYIYVYDQANVSKGQKLECFTFNMCDRFHKRSFVIIEHFVQIFPHLSYHLHVRNRGNERMKVWNKRDENSILRIPNKNDNLCHHTISNA